ncbi:MAG: hypothetical protein HY560_08270, partial [Gemmatimonadetes bacterium]|nr:hypothetical protein [Gemmatimonadota bacterium]
LLLQGRALREADQCPRAVQPLAAAADSGTDVGTRAAAQLLLGECRVTLGEPAAARHVLTPLVDDPDAATAQRARLWRARASLALGEYPTALADLEGTRDTGAVFDRAAALVGMGRLEEAIGELEAAARLPYDEQRWTAVLGSLGAAAPEAAAALADSLVALSLPSPGQRARLLLADADRWRRVGREDRARARFTQVGELAADSAEGRLARAHLLLAELAGSSDLGRVPEIVLELETIAADGGPAAALTDMARRVLSQLEPQNRVREPADLLLFVLAEAVRDSLGAGPLAGTLFLQLQREHPDSPIAPKALLAAAALLPPMADSLVAAVHRDYPDSPYRLAALGLEAPRFAAIEDSLRTLLEAAPGDPTNLQRPEGDLKRRREDERIRRPGRPAPGRRPMEP